MSSTPGRQLFFFAGIVQEMSLKSVNGLGLGYKLGEYKLYFQPAKRLRKSSMHFASYQYDVGQGKLTAVES